MPIEIDIPGFGFLRLSHLVSDYNGTLALDGRLIPGVREGLLKVASFLKIHIITADTFGRATEELRGLPVDLFILDPGHERESKGRFVSSLEGGVAVLGNGSNDLSMMEKGDLSIALLGGEGLYPPLLTRAHVVMRSAVDALGLFLKPERLKATLRS